jgi:Galactose oxidase, central domain
MDASRLYWVHARHTRRETAALVNGIMYVFGGRTRQGQDLGYLVALSLTLKRWYIFQNIGPTPSPRSGHSMTVFDPQIFLLAGEPSSAPRDVGELTLAYVLDTTKIRYLNDSAATQDKNTGDGGSFAPPTDSGYASMG